MRHDGLGRLVEFAAFLLESSPSAAKGAMQVRGGSFSAWIDGRVELKNVLKRLRLTV